MKEGNLQYTKYGRSYNIKVWYKTDLNRIKAMQPNEIVIEMLSFLVVFDIGKIKEIPKMKYTSVATQRKSLRDDSS